MPYAAETDLRVKWGDELVNLLAWDNAASAASEPRIAAALANAGSIIDSYLARRYALPVNPQPDAASLLNSFNCDLAVAQLAIAPGTRSDIIIDAEKRALSFLRDVAEGKAALNLIPAPDAGEPISPGEAVMLADCRGLSREKLRGLSMDGISFTLEISGLDAALGRLNALGTVHFQKLLLALAKEGRMQTMRRIEEEKTSPEGAAWPKTTDGRAALFVTGTHLARSIDHAVVGDAAVWGSGWIGAHIHQFGGVIKPVNATVLAFTIGAKKVFAKKVTIPARPYLGVSAENARDLEETAVTFMTGVMGGASG